MLAVYGSPLSLRQSLIPPGGGRRDTVGSIDTKGAGATGIKGADEYRFKTLNKHTHTHIYKSHTLPATKTAKEAELN